MDNTSLIECSSSAGDPEEVCGGEVLIFLMCPALMGGQGLCGDSL